VLWIGFGVRADSRQVFGHRYVWVEPAAAPSAGTGAAPTGSSSGAATGAGTSAPAAAPGGSAPAEEPAPAEPTVVVTPVFEIAAAQANLRLQLAAGDLDNGWLGLEAALVNEDTGEVRYATLQVEHWSGVDEGEAWSEGDREATAWLGEVPAGRY